MGMRIQKRFVLGVRFAALLVCGLIAGAWMTTPVAGQSGLGSGQVEGTVTDESGATVADATVTALSDSTSVATVQTSDTSGHFLFPYLTPGTYHLSVEKAGFKLTQLDRVIVTVGTTLTLRPELTVGSTDTKVVVTADPQLDPRSVP
jgi:hypothetical protein